MHFLLITCFVHVVQEKDFFEVVDVPVPAGIVLEVGGLCPVGDDLFVATRRGQIWRIEQAESLEPSFELWAEGLQEPLGLVDHQGALWTVQRGELSRMQDTTGDGRMDSLETVADGWGMSGNYHEYAFGPALAPDGSWWLTLNKPFGEEPFGSVPFRGWALRVDAEGAWTAEVAGLRSPAGIGWSPQGALFYTDNQGEWCASSKFAHMQTGEFHGHPWGIGSSALPQSKVQHPGDIPDGLLVTKAAEQIPGYTLPSVWVPWDLCGRSPGGFVWDTEGYFGPYRGQAFVGDQYSAEVFRVDLEQVNGVWQGGCYPFRQGLKAGITRVAWASDGSLWCGMTTRGWPSLGTETEGLQRIRWTGKTPFDLLHIRARPDGFRLRFTAPMDPQSLAEGSVQLRSWTYKQWSTYGSPLQDERELKVLSTTVSEDGMELLIKVQGLRAGYVHEIQLEGVRGLQGRELLHDRGWYTLNQIPKLGS